MKNKYFKIIPLTFLVLSSLLFSCRKDDYITGGSIVNPKVNMTTYDFLQADAWQQFDTLIQLIDKAGLKDVINQPGVTFFAPNDYSVYNYLNKRTVAAQKTDPLALYTLDTLFKYDLARLKDSLKMYIINTPLTYDKLTNNGAKYVTVLTGDTVVVSYEHTTNTNLGYSSSISNVPQIVYFTQLWHPLPEPFKAEDITDDIGVHTICKTSGIQTTTGIVNVLESSHTLFFYGTNK